MASSALVLSPWGGVAFSEHKHALRKMQGCQRMPARAYAPRADLNFTMKFGAKRRAAVPVSASASEPTSSGTLSLDETYATAAGGGGGVGGINTPGMGGGGGDEDGAGGARADCDAVLQASGKSLDSLPGDLAAAVAAGKVSKELLQRYLQLSQGLLAPFMRIEGFRERLMADPGFFVKVGIEVGIGIFTKSSAEYTKRGKRFNEELDFVLANVLMALVADFMLVWLPAPTLSYRPKSAAKAGALASFLAGCPENAFQRVPPGYAPFSPAQRAGAVVRNGAKLLGVGFGASLVGVTMTNLLIGVRQQLDPSFAPPNAPQDVLTMSAAYGSYMAVSSNLRYQILAGVIEERGIEAVFAGNPALCSALSFVVRTSNTFLGSLMWVDYLRLLGLQKVGTDGGH